MVAFVWFLHTRVEPFISLAAGGVARCFSADCASCVFSGLVIILLVGSMIISFIF